MTDILSYEEGVRDGEAKWQTLYTALVEAVRPRQPMETTLRAHRLALETIAVLRAQPPQQPGGALDALLRAGNMMHSACAEAGDDEERRELERMAFATLCHHWETARANASSVAGARSQFTPDELATLDGYLAGTVAPSLSPTPVTPPKEPRTARHCKLDRQRAVAVACGLDPETANDLVRWADTGDNALIAETDFADLDEQAAQLYQFRVQDELHAARREAAQAKP